MVADKGIRLLFVTKRLLQKQTRTILTVTREGEIDRIIRLFHQYELNNFTTCSEPDGLIWWDIVRYSIVHALCMEKGLYGRPESNNVSIVAKLYSFIRQTVKLIKDLVIVTRLSGRFVDTIYISTRKIGLLTQDLQQNTHRCLLIGAPGVKAEHHSSIKKQSIDFFVRIVWRAMRIPKSVARKAEIIDSELHGIFDTQLDIHYIIAKKYRQHRASRLIWSYVLSCLNRARRIVYINDDSLKTLIHLANKRGIETREVQHGYMGRSHEGFSYPTLKMALSTMPNELVLTRDTGDITYPVSKITIDSHDNVNNHTQADKERDIDILVGSTPGRQKQTHDIVMTLVKRGFKVSVKLHPVENETDFNFNPHSATETIKIYSGLTDFKTLANRSMVYVPVSPSSTTAFEADECGAKVITINHNGKKLSEMLDGIASANVDTISDLPDVIDNYLTQKAVQ